MNPEVSEYQAFLLRIWRSNETSDDGWRASLESVETGAKRGFSTLEELFAFLTELCEPSQQLERSNQ